MISRLIVIFGVALASIYLGVWLHHDPGYVFISTNHWTIESTLWVAFLVVMVCIFIAYILVRMVNYLVALPKRWQQWRTTRRLLKAQSTTQKGLIEFNEGRWRNAKKHLIAAASDSNMPLINYLTAAQAAEALGDHTLRDQCLQQAQESSPEAIVAIELVQAQFQLDNQQWEQASATLFHLQNTNPDHPYTLKLLTRLYQHQHNWQDLITILPKIKSAKLFNEQRFLQFKQKIYHQCLQNLIQIAESSELKLWMQNLPKDLKYDPQINYDYGHFLLAQQADKQAELLIRNSLEHQFDESLIRLYAQIEPDVVCLSFIESLLKKFSYSAGLNFCLGEIYRVKKLWGPAKNYFEQSIEFHPSTEAYYGLGQLLEELGDKTAACQTYRQGLVLDNVTKVLTE